LKKTLLLATLLAAFATSASAVDLTVTGGRGTGSTNAGSVTLSQQLPQGFGVGVGVNRIQKGSTHADTFEVTASKEIVKLGIVDLSVYGGGAYTQATVGSGFGLVFGAQAKVPVYKNVSFVVDAQRVMSQNRVANADSNRLTAGVNISF
jgi:hypothetical protein